RKNTAVIPSSAYAFHSARAALLAVLRAGRPTTLWLPYYICDAVIAAAAAAEVSVCLYHLDDDLSVASDLKIGATEWLLYVNYFGVCDSQAQSLLQRFAAPQLIFDHAQALYAPAVPGAST